MTWNEVFSRASMFITVLSAAIVALALVAQATAFGPTFRLFALLVLPIVLLVGLATILRLGAANGEDFGLLMGMNRLRHGYLELAPELEPYFVTENHDDPRSVFASYGMGVRMSLSRILVGTPNLVAAINILVFWRLRGPRRPDVGYVRSGHARRWTGRRVPGGGWACRARLPFDQAWNAYAPSALPQLMTHPCV
jgi:hypothetical protein